MKILVVSLMRMGDLIMQRALLRSIQQKFPNSEIHLMINDLTKPVQTVIHEADQFHIFPRQALQEWMNNSETPLLQPYHYLNSFIKKLSEQQFDIVYNFTHTKLSAYLMAMISSPQKFGLEADGFAFKAFENRWMHYFNDRFTSRVELNFHYIELLGSSLELEPVWPQAEFTSQRNNIVFLSVFSSDEKKNWNLSKFKQLKLQLENRHEHLQFKILCAKSEIDQLLAQFDGSEIVAANFSDSEEYLKNAYALISIDSVIKHLAVECGTPVLEISTGSSDPQRTGPLSSNAVIVLGQSGCYPCKHSTQCPELSFLCSDGISVQSVFLAFEQLISNQNYENNLNVSHFTRPSLKKEIGFILGNSSLHIQLINKLVFSLMLSGAKINFRKSISHPLINEIQELNLVRQSLEFLKFKNQKLNEYVVSAKAAIFPSGGEIHSVSEIISKINKLTKESKAISAELFNFIDSVESAQNSYELGKAWMILQKDLNHFEKINLILIKQLRGEFYGRESQSFDQEQNIGS